MENVDLTKPPFDKPQSFTKLFDAKEQTEIVDIINGIKSNATSVAA